MTDVVTIAVISSVTAVITNIINVIANRGKWKQQNETLRDIKQDIAALAGTVKRVTPVPDSEVRTPVIPRANGEGHEERKR